MKSTVCEADAFSLVVFAVTVGVIFFVLGADYVSALVAPYAISCFDACLAEDCFAAVIIALSC